MTDTEKRLADALRRHSAAERDYNNTQKQAEHYGKYIQKLPALYRELTEARKQTDAALREYDAQGEKQ